VRVENIMKQFKENIINLIKKTSKKVKTQPFPEETIIITDITGNGKFVEIIQIEDFPIYECKPIKINYCAIYDKIIYISSKANYDEVCVHGYNKEQAEKLKIPIYDKRH